MTTVIGSVPEGAELLARDLLDQLDQLTDDLVDRIRVGDEIYAKSTSLTDQQLHSTVHDNLAALLGQLSGTAARRLHPAIVAGRLKAELGIPLAALLHAYRLAGRLIWERSLRGAAPSTQDCLPALGSEIWRLVDDYSSAAADSYEHYLADRVHRDNQRRRTMLRTLLTGTADNATLWGICRALHLPQTGSFVVVHAESDPAAEVLPAIEDRLRAGFVDSFWSTEPDKRIGLLSLVTPRGLGPALDLLTLGATSRIGVSRLFTRPIDAAAALREAEIACRCTTPGVPAVTSYGAEPIPLLLAHAPHPSGELATEILGPILELPATDRNELLDTLDLWFECAGSNLEVARRLHFHRNTIHNRLRRIENLTNRRCADPKAAAELYIALRAARLMDADHTANS
ncbi:helix-turn-helix domain-containing protein [Nocardia sp. NPDC004654]|uniref:PucR family transcriptional regulator n=1 Tax=Nocardia sp. NPDC004654 TaxID=3154776 RepID=UPI0033AFB963